MGSDAHELMHSAQSTNRSRVLDMNVPTQIGTVGEHDIVFQDTIMGDMCVRHKDALITYAGYTLSGGGSAADGSKFPDLIVVADNDGCIFTSVLAILGDASDNGKWRNTVVRPDGAV